jgi:DNA mismatch repair ATPase MutS
MDYMDRTCTPYG